MGDDMELVEVTQVLRTLFGEGGERKLSLRHGQQAVEVAREMADLLEVHLQEEGPHGSLWREFKNMPEERAPELTGALEALVEADPALERRLEAFMERLGQGSSTPLTGTALIDPGGAVQEDTVPVEAGIDEIGQGTYLRGNVPGGTESEGRKIGLDESDLGGQGRLKRRELADVTPPEYFRELSRTVKDHPGISSAAKFGLEAELRKIQTLVARGDELNRVEQDRLVSHLKNVHRLGKDIFEILMQRFRETRSELSGKVQDAIGRVS
jgi:hypothetical protein